MKKMILAGVLIFTTGILDQTKINKFQQPIVCIKDISVSNTTKNLASGD